MLLLSENQKLEVVQRLKTLSGKDEAIGREDGRASGWQSAVDELSVNEIKSILEAENVESLKSIIDPFETQFGERNLLDCRPHAEETNNSQAYYRGYYAGYREGVAEVWEQVKSEFEE